MTKKNRSKAGRKPKANKDKLMTTIAIRLPADMYATLKKKSGRRQISDMVRSYVNDGFTSQKKRTEFFHTDSAEGLALFIGKFVGAVESQTKAAWNTDRFTFEAIRAGIEFILSDMLPEGELYFSMNLEQRIQNTNKQIELTNDPQQKKLLQSALDMLSNPHSLGIASALGCLDMLKMAPFTPAPANMKVSNIFYDYPYIRRKLESKKKE